MCLLVVFLAGDVMSVSCGGPAPSGGPQLAATTSELDQLLTGMLMNVENIPDIRASQTRHLHRDIDVDSIQVSGSPGFSLFCFLKNNFLKFARNVLSVCLGIVCVGLGGT